MNSRQRLGSIWWSLCLGLAVRLAFMLYGVWQDSTKGKVVKYTDVDYFVFSDAAAHVYQGRSPYNRATYRYTPLLAWMLVPNITLSPMFGKVLFIACDVLAGWLIYIITSKYTEAATSLLAAQMWLFNPLPIIVSSRGNAESIMAVLVLASLNCMHSRKIWSLSAAFGLLAASVHFKIYPVTYALPYYLNLQYGTGRRHSYVFGNDIFPTPTRVMMVAIATVVFALLTGGCYWLYGWDFLQETYLHHLTRRDTRHNFSVYFYMLYLGGSQWWGRLSSLLAFLPQLVLLLVVSFKYNGDLTFACFLNTFIFVTFNKVVTSQYFLWYLCLLPLVLPNINMSYREATLLVLSWAAAQALWLTPAYYLEFEGINTFVFIWMTGLVFFLDNLLIMYRLTIAYSSSSSGHCKPRLKRPSLTQFRRTSQSNDYYYKLNKSY